MDSGLPTTLTRVDGLWIPRETIVIRVEDTIFQVPRAVLAAQSTVFREMLSFPQPPTPETELVDGSPVVRLHDAAKDVEVFLRAIFDASFFIPAPAPTELSTVLGILRLSHKYDVQFLYRRALDHLAKDGWYTRTYDEDNTHHIPFTHDTALLYAFRTAAVAAEVGALWLLPWAYYAAATYASADLLPFIDGEFQVPARKALGAQTQLMKESLQVNRFLLVDDTCTMDRGCSTTRLGFCRDSLDDIALEPGRAGLRPFVEWTPRQLRALGLQMCSPCAVHAIDHTKKVLTALFDKLPGMFGLPPWAELHTMKRAAMGEEDGGKVNED